MKKAVSLLLALMLALGCAAAAQAASVSFTLPEGFSIRQISSTEWAILLEDTSVGSIQATELDYASLTSDILYDYMESLLAPELGVDYVFTSFEARYVIVSCQPYDAQTLEPVEKQKYCLFRQDGVCYSLLLDSTLVDADRRSAVFLSLGLVDGAQS